MRLAPLAALLSGVFAATSVGAAGPTERPAAFQKLLDCRSVGDTAQRLACFDREVAAVAVAEGTQKLVVIDRAKVRTARKTLFGLSVPDLGIFGGGQEDEIDRIEGVIAAATRNGDGRWTFRLADGARWMQADNLELFTDPAVGQPIAIRKAAMGSFLANVNKQIAIRVRRVN